jgi:hypothetical protein
MLARIPTGYSNLAVSSVLSVQCVRIIDRIPRKAPLSEEKPVLQSRNEDLHNILTDLLKLTTLTTTKMENVLCYGLVAYCLPLQYGIPLPIATTRTLQTCVEAYMQLNFSENEEKLDGKCMLWVAMVISSCLDICADPDLRHAPVLDRILSKFPQAKNWKKVDAILQTFLWHEDLAPLWYSTWQGVMSRRRSPPGGSGVSPQAFSPATVTASSPAPGATDASRRLSTTVPTTGPKTGARSMKVSSLLSND